MELPNRPIWLQRDSGSGRRGSSDSGRPWNGPETGSATYRPWDINEGWYGAFEPVSGPFQGLPEGLEQSGAINPHIALCRSSRSYFFGSISLVQPYIDHGTLVREGMVHFEPVSGHL